MRPRSNVAGIIWGLLFCFIAGLGFLWSSDITLNFASLGLIIPLFLIALGALGIVLARRN